MTLGSIDLNPLQVASRLGTRPGFFWLDGDARFGTRGRWSFLGCDPVEVRRGTEPWLDAFEGLDAAHGQDRSDQPFAPRWVGFVAFDAEPRAGDDRKRRTLPGPEVPTVWLGRYGAVVAYDHLNHSCHVVGDGEGDVRALMDALGGGEVASMGFEVSGLHATTDAAHGAAIERAQAYMATGDIYQVNLSRMWQGTFAGSPLGLYLRMREAGPVPVGAYLNAGDVALLCRSMETFLDWNVDSGRLASRPIKGTRPLGVAHTAQENESALPADAKEHAEHVMIVDLMRNDLGRVARSGSVEVTGLLEVEHYAGLSHLVSTVQCRTRDGVTVTDIVGAAFPPGSVTGTPKVRALDVILELEGHRRGVFTGCIGFISRGGGMKWAVAIRTAQVQDRHIYYHAGGGIVTASRFKDEVRETGLKAEVFLRSLR